ncbi:unnamed protein product [Acanthoscelides obtectus]|uniref:Uncharacterized protein n=1 Tax=Acanthoscelides obtectus TaxID=200917 RepID=A0A9P0Q510_ACAOB|nr:unnamed protein product [Acanthoscelides obtectus]CAK1662638.1 hypothetical protein AOBTE_LOCUS23249 [Acanthoscelides obtectus]
MKTILFLVTFTAVASAQDSWRQSRDYLGPNVKSTPLVQNPSYVSQNPIHTNQRIGASNSWAPPASLENALNPKKNQKVSSSNTWLPPARLKNILNPTNQHQGASYNWKPPENQFNQQQPGGYIGQQQYVNPVRAQGRHGIVTQQPISITYSPLQQQNVPKHQQKKDLNYKKPGLKNKQTPKKPVYQPHVVYDPFAQNTNQQIQPLPYIPPEPRIQSYQSNPLNQAQKLNNTERQSYAKSPITFRYNKKQPDQHTHPSVRSSKVINHLKKDYRDYKTHEPQADDNQYEREEQEYDREEAEDEPTHEEYEVPTKPIYPGEGQWAIRGKKHRPFIRGDKPVDLEEDDEVPDGYETFLQGQKVFERTKADLSKQFDQVPQQHKLGKYLPEREDESEDSKEDQFVPVRLYAQVRHSEDEKHLPRSAADDERLKELVKDSKIHTVYSEEGYEDDAYDHAGHEKNAETGEAFEQAGKLHDRKIVKKIPDKILEQIKEDSNVGGAENADASSSATQNVKNPSNDTTKVLTKEAYDVNVKPKVEGGIKVLTKPENATKDKPISKSLPKVLKQTKLKDSEFKASAIKENVLKKKIWPTSTSLPGTKAANDGVGEILTEDIPATTLSTTAIPKKQNEINVVTILSLGKEEQPLLPFRQGKRRKRETFDRQKYPYYQVSTLNPNSPLRYSEDLRNIPDKTRDNLAFYRQAETRYRCPEIDRTVDPIPDKVNGKTAATEQEEEESEEDEEETDPSNHKPPSKRLNQLGDKIDCLKVKYFGANPFDSPFFAEPTVGPVKPVLNFNDKLSMSVPLPPPAFSKEPYIKEQMRHLPVVVTVLPTEYQEEPYTNHQLREQFIKQQVKDFPPVILPTAAPREKYTDEQLKELQDQYSEEQLRQLQEEYIRAELAKLNVPYMKDEFDHMELPYGTPPHDLYKNEHNEKSTTPKSKPKPSQSSANTISLRKVKINPKIALHSTTEDIYNDDESIEENEVFSASEPRQNVIPMEAKDANADSKQLSKKGQAPLEVTTESVNLLTTPKYTIDLKPKHIYHQIELLGYLPGQNDSQQNATSRMDQVVENPNDQKANESVRVVITLDENKRKPKIYIEEVAPKFPVLGGSEGVGRAQAVRRIRIKHKRPSSSRDTGSKYAPSRIVIPLHGKEPSTETPKYRSSSSHSLPYSTPRPYINSSPYSSNYQQASFQDKIKVRIVRPTLQIFDINKFLPTTEAPLFDDLDMYGEGSAPLPKYKVISEVYYKDDMKPNEQLMLLADVMSHIRNSSRRQVDDSSKDYSETIPVTLKNISKNKAGKQQVDRGFHEVNAPISSTSHTRITSTTTTTIKPVMYDDTSKRPRIRRVKYRKKKLRSTTPATTTTAKLPEENTEAVVTTEVVDLKPPGVKTYNPNKMNKYYVQGMRPPPKQKLFMYSDYLKNELNRNRQRLHRSKRSPVATKYAELSRSKVKATTSQPEADDYVPNRTRNWHYDDKTGKIVYHNVPKFEEDKDVEVVYEEVTEPVIPFETEKPKQNPVFATATPPPEGQSYIDFVKKLKSASNYVHIPDPTTTEKSVGSENLVSTTLKPVSTTPPEFLSILSKVKSNIGYKLIEDEKDKKTTTTTTTQAAEPEMSESQGESVQNAPGGMGMNNFQIFDITDYIPKIKHYLPVTGVDTSKYTTIQRPKTDTPKAEEERSNQSSEDKVSVTVERDNPSSTMVTPIVSSTTASTTRTTATPPSGTTSDTSQSIEVGDSIGSSDLSRKRRRRKRRRKIVGQGTNSTTLSPESPERVSSETSQVNNRGRRLQATTEKFLFDTVDEVTKSVVRRSDNSDTRFQRLYEIEEPSASKVESKGDGASVKEGDADKEMYVVILQPYDPNVKTGGNYKEEPSTGEIAANKPSLELYAKPIQVFKPHDPNQKTGGNYRAAPANITENKTDTSPSSRKYVEVFQQYDPEKKTGGNYRAEGSYNVQKTALPQTVEEPKKYVEVFQQFDPNKKTGGAYITLDKEKLIEDIGHKSYLPSTVEDPKKYVEVFQQYEPNKKTGGGYESNDKEKLIVEDIDQKTDLPGTVEEPKKYVEVFQKYDQSKKTGGGYKDIDKDKLIAEDVADPVDEVMQPKEPLQKTGKNQEKEELTPNDEEEKPVEIFQPYNPNQKHGGNYRSDPNKNQDTSASVTSTEEVETLEEPIAAENQHSFPKKYRETVASTTVGIKTTEGPLVINLLSNFDKPDEAKNRNFDLRTKKRKIKKPTNGKESVTRLTDIIPKPETYYTDPNLPKAVNMLMEVNLPDEEIEKIVEGKDSSEQAGPKKHPTKAELSRAKVSRKSFKQGKKLVTTTTTTTTTVKPVGYQVTEEPAIEDTEEGDQFEERKEAEESRTVTEKQRIEDRDERSEPEVEEPEIDDPDEVVHHNPGGSHENKSSFKEEYIHLDDDHDHHHDHSHDHIHDHDHDHEIEDMSEDEDTSTTEKLKNLPNIIKDPSKRLYYYLPA